jgi:hypothetical protein
MAQINKSSEYFNTILWTGDGTSSRSITGVGFAPDMVWLKGRTTTFDHRLVDTLRSGTYPKLLYPNQDIAESEDVNNIGAIGSDGFTVGSGNAVNQSGQTYVAWNWLAGGTGASNTDGSITSTVSANTTSGFSIVSYTGTGANATVGHGLGIAPKFIIVKARNEVRYWAVQTSTGAGFEMNLNVTEGQTATSVYWNSTDPTSSVFSVGTNAATNLSGDDYIAYVFAPIKGFSKFGSYTGNGSTDGTFVYTGFKPAFVMVKRTDTTNAWLMHDIKRSTLNPMDNQLFANTSGAEDTTSTNNNFDFLSQGFKCRNTGAAYNASGGTYIYMAFAESPLVGTNNIPAVAR